MYSEISPVKPLTEREFHQISTMVYKYCRINLTPKKKCLVSSRLMSRLVKLNLSSYTDYLEHLENRKGATGEFEVMVNLLSTHTTSFFREPDHFDFLTDKILPELTNLEPVQKRRAFNIWSAGCSSGEEAYTLGMVATEFLTKYPGFQFKVTASDVAEETLGKAQKAIYKEKALSGIPPYYKSRYFLKGIKTQGGFYRVVPELRERIIFKKINLGDNFSSHLEKQDIIFCRNVTIYFDPDTRKKLIGGFYDHLIPGGYLFIGHSESLLGIINRFEQVIPTVYRRPLS